MQGMSEDHEDPFQDPSVADTLNRPDMQIAYHLTAQTTPELRVQTQQVQANGDNRRLSVSRPRKTTMSDACPPNRPTDCDVMQGCGQTLIQALPG
jgi:hypothetical protein